MAPATRTQAVYDPQTGEHKTFEVINITDQVQAGLQKREADRKALREKIYGTDAKADSGKPKAEVEPPKAEEPKPPKK